MNASDIRLPSQMVMPKESGAAVVAPRRLRECRDGECPTPFLQIAADELKDLKKVWSFA
jgi:hypothetical protein